MRPPSVFVRDLSLEEGNRLKRLSRKAASDVKRERALIARASVTKMSVQQIAALVGTDESHARKVIRAFNERGFGSPDPEARAGGPPEYRRAARSHRRGGQRAPRHARGCRHWMVADASGALPA